MAVAAPVPRLNLQGYKSKGLTPRGSARSAGSTPGAPFALSARRLLKPEVGMTATISALGELTAPWSPGRALDQKGKADPIFPGVDGRVPYNVGRTRARAQMKLAFTTDEENSRLRRISAALDSNRFDRCLKRELEVSTMQAKELSRKLGVDFGIVDLSKPDEEEQEVKQDSTKKKEGKKRKADESKVEEGSPPNVEPQLPETAASTVEKESEGRMESAAAEAEKESEGPPPASSLDDEEKKRRKEEAATRIQAIQRGKHDRADVKEGKEKRRKEEAATRIQAIQRGKHDRADVKKKKEGAVDEKTEAVDAEQ